VIGVRAVFQQAHRELAIEAMTTLLLPRNGRYGLHDYDKTVCADIKGGNDICAMRGDIAHALPLDGHKQPASFFDGFILPRSDQDARRTAEIAVA
jgi:phenol 2-monooxygenase (NADPH)